MTGLKKATTALTRRKISYAATDETGGAEEACNDDDTDEKVKASLVVASANISGNSTNPNSKQTSMATLSGTFYQQNL